MATNDDDEDEFTPRNIQVTKRDTTALKDTLTGELQRGRALVEIFNSTRKDSQTPTTTESATNKPPLSSRLSDYPAGGVDLENIVTYPPRLESFPVKPLFLDVAWNYIEYPGKSEQARPVQATTREEKTGAGAGAGAAAAAAAAEPEAKPQKKGWFGFGR